MITLVSKAASEARLRNSKRVTSSHLKAAIQRGEVLDFLADIIKKVPDAPPSAKKEDGEGVMEGEDEMGGGIGHANGEEGGQVVRKKRGGRRRKVEEE